MAKRNGEKPEENNNNNNPPAEASASDAQKASIPAYLEATLRLPTSYPLGSEHTDTEIASNPAGVRVVDTHTTAGICVLDYLPTMGYSEDANSAVNRGTAQDFNEVRCKISGTRKYQKADMYIERAAVDSLRDLYYYIERLYGIVNTYRATNKYTPRRMLQAMGFAADDIIDNAANIHYWLITHAGSLKSYPTVPMGNITSRRRLYNSALFSDGDIESTQTYILNQKCFWSYEVVDQVKGLTPRWLGDSWDSIKKVWNDMYTALTTSTDVDIISADIRTAFGDNVITELTPPPENYQAPIQKFDEILASLMNATVLNIVDSGMPAGRDALLERVARAFRIEDRNGLIMCRPVLECNALSDNEFGYWNHVLPANRYHINTVSAAPDARELLNATRFVCNVEIGKGVDYATSITYKSFGTEVIIGARVISMTGPGEVETSLRASIPFSGLITPFLGSTSNGYAVTADDQLKGFGYVTRLLSAISACDWHPPITVAPYVDHGGVSKIVSWDTVGTVVAEEKANVNTIEDVQNYVPVTQNQIKQIHEVSLLAEFKVQ